MFAGPYNPKRFIVLKPDVRAGAEVVGNIKQFVKVRLTANEYLQEIEFA